MMNMYHTWHKQQNVQCIYVIITSFTFRSQFVLFPSGHMAHRSLRELAAVGGSLPEGTCVMAFSFDTYRMEILPYSGRTIVTYDELRSDLQNAFFEGSPVLERARMQARICPARDAWLAGWGDKDRFMFESRIATRNLIPDLIEIAPKCTDSECAVAVLFLIDDGIGYTFGIKMVTPEELDKFRLEHASKLAKLVHAVRAWWKRKSRSESTDNQPK